MTGVLGMATRCDFVSERAGVRCQLPRNHVNHPDPKKQDHRAWDVDGIPTLKAPSEPVGEKRS